MQLLPYLLYPSCAPFFPFLHPSAPGWRRRDPQPWVFLVKVINQHPHFPYLSFSGSGQEPFAFAGHIEPVDVCRAPSVAFMAACLRVNVFFCFCHSLSKVFHHTVHLSLLANVHVAFAVEYFVIKKLRPHHKVPFFHCLFQSQLVWCKLFFVHKFIDSARYGD